ncbi:MAG: hypothetical protein DRJ10_09215 [Bacteroidetes bacterium]|nr:MAG: hypothetical protein DRJ10_09215 [Bacteroidota bacterium]
MGRQKANVQKRRVWCGGAFALLLVGWLFLGMKPNGAAMLRTALILKFYLLTVFITLLYVWVVTQTGMGWLVWPDFVPCYTKQLSK